MSNIKTTEKRRKNNLGKQSNKGLQRFTVFEGITTKEDFINFISLKPENAGLMELWIVKRLNEELEKSGEIDKFWRKYEILTELSKKENLPDIRRERYQANKILIERAIKTGLTKHGAIPSQAQISKETGLSRVTINNHIKEGVLSPYYQEELEVLKLLSTDVLSLLYRIGVENRDVKALKVFLEYTRNSSPSLEIKQQNNYIQINNTRIDEATIKQLPDETRLQIERLILNRSNQ